MPADTGRQLAHATRAVLSDDGSMIRLALYTVHDGGMAVVLAPVRAVALGWRADPGGDPEAGQPHGRKFHDRAAEAPPGC